ncbi:amidinotransferase, partial [Streptomyces sp. NPDC093516]
MAVTESPGTVTAADAAVQHPAPAGPGAQDLARPVNSHNEWDPLEEIIVGRLEGATIPSGHPVVTCN